MSSNTDISSRTIGKPEQAKEAQIYLGFAFDALYSVKSTSCDIDKAIANVQDALKNIKGYEEWAGVSLDSIETD